VGLLLVVVTSLFPLRIGNRIEHGMPFVCVLTSDFVVSAHDIGQGAVYPLAFFGNLAFFIALAFLLMAALDSAGLTLKGIVWLVFGFFIGSSIWFVSLKLVPRITYLNSTSF